MIRRASLVVAALAAPALADDEPVPPSAPDPVPIELATQAAQLAAQGEQLAAQQQAIDRLSAALDAEAHARDTRKPAVESAWSHVTISGLLQIDAALRQSSEDELRQTGEPLNQDRVLLRRGRPRVTADYGDVSGLLEIDLNTVSGNQVRVSTAQATYRATPWLDAGLGIPKIPFGFEVVQADRDRLFLERSTVIRALFPGEYDVGGIASGSWRFVRYAIAVQNGEPIGEKAFALRDPNRAKDITARAGIASELAGVKIAAGVSMLSGTGFHAGTPATKDSLVWRDLNEDGAVNAGEIQIVAGQAATPSSNFDRSGLGADVQVTIDLHEHGTAMLYGELIAATNLDRAIVLPDPVVTGRDFRELGFYVAGIVEPSPRTALGIRYDRYDPDADAQELRTGNVVPLSQVQSSLSLCGALRYQHARLILEYDHNRNHAGRSTSGEPINLKDDALTLRAEVTL